MTSQDAPNGSAPSRRPRRRLLIVAAVALVLVVVAGGALWWYVKDDAPAKVDLDHATAGVTSVPGSQTATLPGTWTVDTTTGSFDFSKATGTFAGFRVSEQLSNIGSTTAVGRTGSVRGSMTIVGSKVTAASFQVDLRSITTDRRQRNQRVQQALETDRFPEATFTLTDPITLPSEAGSGREIDVDAKGRLTIHGVARVVTIPLKAKLTGQTVVVVGSIGLRFSDYGVTVPRAPIVLSVDDHGTMEMQLLLTKR